MTSEGYYTSKKSDDICEDVCGGQVCFHLIVENVSSYLFFVSPLLFKGGNFGYFADYMMLCTSLFEIVHEGFLGNRELLSLKFL